MAGGRPPRQPETDLLGIRVRVAVIADGRRRTDKRDADRAGRFGQRNVRTSPAEVVRLPVLEYFSAAGTGTAGSPNLRRIENEGTVSRLKRSELRELPRQTTPLTSFRSP
jgi:hypothetical protein